MLHTHVDVVSIQNSTLYTSNQIKLYALVIKSPNQLKIINGHTIPFNLEIISISKFKLTNHAPLVDYVYTLI